MEIVRTKEFEKELKKLPSEVAKLLTRQIDVFNNNWRHPYLHTKKLQGLEGVYSIRVTRRYRALFYFQDSHTVIFFDIDHRKDIYR